MLDHELIQRKVKLIQEDLAKLEPLSELNFDQVAKDPVKYGATERYRISRNIWGASLHFPSLPASGGGRAREGEVDSALGCAHHRLSPSNSPSPRCGEGEGSGSESPRNTSDPRYLERIVTRAIDVNRHVLAKMGKGNESVRTYEETFLRLADLGVYPEVFARKIAPSVGLRNVLVHEYDEVDPKLVFQSVGKALSQYAKYCDYFLKFLEKKSRITSEQ